MGNWTTKTYLLISGLIIILVGGFISLTPNEYLASMNVQSGMDLSGSIDNNRGNSVSLLSDLRAMGGLMIVIGLYVFMAAFREDLMKSTILVSAIFYNVFVVFRALGFMLDGMPQSEIMMAFVIELILAFFGFLLVVSKKHQCGTKQSENPVQNN